MTPPPASPTRPVIGRFTDRYPFFGPVLWMAAISFFVAQVGVAYTWQSRARLPSGTVPDHPYGFFANTISDLGETSKFTYGTPAMWSPDHGWMNAAFIVLGAVMIMGAPFIYQEYNETTSAKVWIARIGFAAQVLAGGGAITVGLIPENVNGLGHEIGAGLAIAIGTLGVFLLGLSLPRLPGRIRLFMLWMPVALMAILLYALHEYLGFGPGGMERVAAYPEVIWLIMFGFYIARSHYSYGSSHRPAGPNASRLRFHSVGHLPRARKNEPYSVAIGSLGGAGQQRTFSPRSRLPPGLALAPNGILSGTPTESGFHRLKIDVTDETSIAVKTFTLPIGR